MPHIPAAIRYLNPGAMWPGAIPTKWGSKSWVYLSDGTGQGGGGHGNKIAVFDNWVDGICAQLDLWRSSPNYKNKRFADAINVWDGGNHTESYIAYVTARVPDMTADTIMNDAFWRGPMAIPFLKAQSGHEAGQTIPASDADWITAQKRVMSGVPTVNTVKKAGGAAGSVVVTTAAAHASGLSLPIALAIGVAIAVVVFLVWKFKPAKVVNGVVAEHLPTVPMAPPAEQPK